MKERITRWIWVLAIALIYFGIWLIAGHERQRLDRMTPEQRRAWYDDAKAEGYDPRN